MFIEQKENIVKASWRTSMLMSTTVSPKRTAGGSVRQLARSVEHFDVATASVAGQCSRAAVPLNLTDRFGYDGIGNRHRRMKAVPS